MPTAAKQARLHYGDSFHLRLDLFSCPLCHDPTLQERSSLERYGTRYDQDTSPTEATKSDGGSFETTNVTLFREERAGESGAQREALRVGAREVPGLRRSGTSSPLAGSCKRGASDYAGRHYVVVGRASSKETTG
jgi:hypothetical protein